MLLTKFSNRAQGQLGMIQNNDDYAKQLRLDWKQYYTDYFYNMLVNLYHWENLPDGFDERYIENTLVSYGKIGVFEDETIGLTHLKGEFNGEMNLFGYQKKFKPTPADNFKLIGSEEKTIIWNKSDITANISKRCVIIPNNNQFAPTTHVIDMFAQKLADIEATMHQNRVAQVTPYMIVANNRNILSLKNIISKIFSFEPVVYLNQSKKSDLLEKSIEDKIKVLNLDAPYLLDKLQDDKQHVINQFLTFVGINNSPVDKKERLVSAEVDSNNDLLLSNMMVGLKSRQEAVDIINAVYGTDIKVSLYTQAFDSLNGGDKFDASERNDDDSRVPEE